MRLLQVHGVARVHVVVERLVDQFLRLVPRQLRHAENSKEISFINFDRSKVRNSKGCFDELITWSREKWAWDLATPETWTCSGAAWSRCWRSAATSVLPLPDRRCATRKLARHRTPIFRRWARAWASGSRNSVSPGMMKKRDFFFFYVLCARDAYASEGVVEISP